MIKFFGADVDIVYGSHLEFSSLIGKTISGYEICEDKEYLAFQLSDGSGVILHHIQDCCESVYLNDITGDLDDLLNTPILVAEKSVSSDSKPDVDHSETWTFYKLATIKGYVDLRWYGTSNGYYSESVYFSLLTPN